MMYVNREPRFYVDITFSNSKWFDGTEGDYIVDFTYSGSCGKEQVAMTIQVQVIWCAKEWIPATVTRTWFVCSCV